eukprot:6197884-Pleurochrysis_carterae.AAC.2
MHAFSQTCIMLMAARLAFGTRQLGRCRSKRISKYADFSVSAPFQRVSMTQRESRLNAQWHNPSGSGNVLNNKKTIYAYAIGMGFGKRRQASNGHTVSRRGWWLRPKVRS